jgi:hypothetical protein
MYLGCFLAQDDIDIDDWAIGSMGAWATREMDTYDDACDTALDLHVKVSTTNLSASKCTMGTIVGKVVLGRFGIYQMENTNINNYRPMFLIVFSRCPSPTRSVTS